MVGGKEDIRLVMTQTEINEVRELKDHIRAIGKPEKWMQQAAVDGKSAGAYRQRWQTLIAQIQEVCNYHESVMTEQFGQEVELSENNALPEQKQIMETVREILLEKGKINKLTLVLHKEYGAVLELSLIHI